MIALDVLALLRDYPWAQSLEAMHLRSMQENNSSKFHLHKS